MPRCSWTPYIRDFTFRDHPFQYNCLNVTSQVLTNRYAITWLPSPPPSPVLPCAISLSPVVLVMTECLHAVWDGPFLQSLYVRILFLYRERERERERESYTKLKLQCLAELPVFHISLLVSWILGTNQTAVLYWTRSAKCSWRCYNPQLNISMDTCKTQPNQQSSPQLSTSTQAVRTPTLQQQRTTNLISVQTRRCNQLLVRFSRGRTRMFV
jgi:hypothetical protein